MRDTLACLQDNCFQSMKVKYPSPYSAHQKRPQLCQQRIAPRGRLSLALIDQLSTMLQKTNGVGCAILTQDLRENLFIFTSADWYLAVVVKVAVACYSVHDQLSAGNVADGSSSLQHGFSWEGRLKKSKLKSTRGSPWYTHGRPPMGPRWAQAWGPHWP
jgi:hypothetical protein